MPDTGFISGWYCIAKLYAFAPVGIAANSTTTLAAVGGKPSSLVRGRRRPAIASSLRNYADSAPNSRRGDCPQLLKAGFVPVTVTPI